MMTSKDTLYDQILLGLISVNHKSPTEVRFWARVDKDGPEHILLGKCWLWVRPQKEGYGTLYVDGRPCKAHRYSYLLNVGEIEDGQQVLHGCDNPSCVNPSHLFLGTQGDNISDMVGKNRQAGAVGAKNSHVKLTEDQVLEIRRLYVYGSRATGTYALARRFGVSDSLIHQIVRHECWRHI